VEYITGRYDIRQNELNWDTQQTIHQEFNIITLCVCRFLIVVLLSVVILSVIMLNVVAPITVSHYEHKPWLRYKSRLKILIINNNQGATPCKDFLDQ
jgi:hypothetical protein